MLIILHLNHYMTGDLGFYANVLGMHESSSDWYLFCCMLSCIEWQQSAESYGEKQTIAFLTETYNAVKNEIQSITTPMHNKTMGPDDFFLPILRM